MTKEEHRKQADYLEHKAQEYRRRAEWHRRVVQEAERLETDEQKEQGDD